jgi:hypothetical protein
MLKKVGKELSTKSINLFGKNWRAFSTINKK